MVPTIWSIYYGPFSFGLFNMAVTSLDFQTGFYIKFILEKDKTKEYDVAVYYSIPTEDESSVSVPVRFEFEGDDGFRLVNEIFNFRIDEIPAEVFLLPELAACKTSHTPTIPAMTANFHAKIEVCDRIGYENIGKLW